MPLEVVVFIFSLARELKYQKISEEMRKDFEEYENFADSIGACFFPVSTKLGINVNESVIEMALRSVLRKHETVGLLEL